MKNKEYEELKKAIESARKELPKCISKDFTDNMFYAGYHTAKDLFLPILAKYLLKIKELENENRKLRKMRD